MRQRLRHMWVGLAASGLLLLLAAAVGYLVRDGAGAAGAVAGVVLVAASYSVSSLALAWADSVNPQLILKVGLGVYLVKITVIGVVMAVILDSGWAGLEPMGAGVIAAVVVWCAAQIWWLTYDRRRTDQLS